MTGARKVSLRRKNEAGQMKAKWKEWFEGKKAMKTKRETKSSIKGGCDMTQRPITAEGEM